MKRFALTLALCIGGTTAALAHDGSHGPIVLARVDTAQVVGHAVAVVLTVTGLDPDHAVHIGGFATDGADATALQAPVPVHFAQDATIRTQLQFHDTPPGIFTLAIDFGADGQGGVVVMPVQAPANAQD